MYLVVFSNGGTILAGRLLRNKVDPSVGANLCFFRNLFPSAELFRGLTSWQDGDTIRKIVLYFPVIYYHRRP